MSAERVNQLFRLSDQGIDGLGNVFYNLNESELLSEAVNRQEGELGIGDVLLVNTGEHTGRSPTDRFIVRTDDVIDQIWWENNQPMDESAFDRLEKDFKLHMQDKDYFVQDLHGGAQAEYRLNIRVVTELAWHGLFIRHLLRRPDESELSDFVSDFTIINCPSFLAEPKRHGCKTSTVIAINLSKKLILIGGTAYAGENKKSVFALLNFILPEKNVMPMHCSANHALDDPDDLAVFFGLSGTGKTTLSAEQNRILLGDDEHGWSEKGTFNFEGGCYAKTINLSKEAEPEIFATTSKFATIIENMVYHPDTKELYFDDDSLTANMRCAYPLNYISNASTSSLGGPPKNIIMLTCDAFGVLPPISRLTSAQAMYHFLSGFTSKVAGTERGVTEPQPTFSTCFGAPFMPRRPEVYGNLLKSKIAENNSICWLVNTGWTGGPYGIGERMPIKATRTLLNAALSGEISDGMFRKDKNFGFEVPLSVKNVDPNLLDPKKTWEDSEEYDKQARRLVEMFVSNFDQYVEHVDSSVKDIMLK